ncbi:MAG: hypothetical protein JXA21_22770 [Anaerolineae bacterium]|nr:hypothetical protein [Anaerolineae bacterium]
MTQPPHYLSFLLRLWQTQDRGHSVWRASLESPKTGDRLGFANLQELMIFLERQTASQENTSNQKSKE